MSQIDPTDLLCRSRREELSVDEQRRLNESLERSLEVKLMSGMLSELERESRVRPGDDALLARIAARAVGRPKAPAKRRALSMVLVAAAVLLVAGMAGAWLGHAREPGAAGESWQVFSGWPWKATKRQRPRTVLPSVKPIPSQTARVEPEAENRPAPLDVESETPVPAPNSSGAARTAREPRAASSTASELFARANLLRRQGRGGDAAGVYQLLLDLYPNSREAGPTRLALAKYFQAKQPEQALSHYRAVASGGGALRAEALWGIAETATTVGERSLAQQALADLIREFPDSPYAEVARTRTTHGSP
jgi:tetratricopeptide (TPR) repeat protein